MTHILAVVDANCYQNRTRIDVRIIFWKIVTLNEIVTQYSLHVSVQCIWWQEQVIFRCDNDHEDVCFVLD